ncbi:hypothetical protein EPUS_02426 [Endocarpon pusillum Z07020]|uniref:DUF7492 domain-containing protein n=1 Tax=Endocarpon pusillum (strain Z07020 / HMAS-L-300199) TaxID=1263415 RepID=U1HPB7_ENDPU|nr:uncharacterized protein EPUS_02426 [Endocarpon pusillum Z07020]ERF70904.1 hypothetical protein EPUS_02426 [Endocarpon pusillum Z07020]
MLSSQSISKILFGILSVTSVAHAHTWIEQLTAIAPNGTFVGEPGYPRGNILRTEPGFSDVPLVHLITGAPNDPMCKDSQKSTSSQTKSSPRLKTVPGADIALRYQENGHVTLPENQPGKAENRGNIFVYGTTEPKDNELFNDVHGVWTADGKGGDGRGVLLAKGAYDDGQCYQVNGGAISTNRQKMFAHPTNQLMGADLWCQTDIRLPSDALTGKPYTLYWVWEWPTAAGIDPGLPKGKNETYTSCIDVDLDQSVGDLFQKVASSGFVQDQPVENAAVPDQFSKLGEQPAATGSTDSAPPSSAPSTSAPVPGTPASSAAPGSSDPVASSTAALAPTTISPIPGSSASASSSLATSASSVVLSASISSFEAIPTIILPIPGPDAPSTTPSAAATSSQAVSDISVQTLITSVITTERVTTTEFVTLPATAAPTPGAAPKIRGRNPIFNLGN